MTNHKYTAPSCEQGSQWELEGLLASSDLDGIDAGDLIGDGGEYEF